MDNDGQGDLSGSSGGEPTAAVQGAADLCSLAVMTRCSAADHDKLSPSWKNTMSMSFEREYRRSVSSPVSKSNVQTV